MLLRLKPIFFFFNSLIPVHLNIRSLFKHFDSLCLFLQSLPFKPAMICLTETRVKDQPLAKINLSNYSFVHTQSHSNAGGFLGDFSSCLNEATSGDKTL